MVTKKERISKLTEKEKAEYAKNILSSVTGANKNDKKVEKVDFLTHIADKL